MKTPLVVRSEEAEAEDSALEEIGDRGTRASDRTVRDRVRNRTRKLWDGAVRLGAAVARDKQLGQVGEFLDGLRDDEEDSPKQAQMGPLDEWGFRRSQIRLEALLDLASRASSNGRGQLDLDDLAVLVAQSTQNQANEAFELARGLLGEIDEYQPLYTRARARLEAMELARNDMSEIKKADVETSSRQFYDLLRQVASFGGDVQDLIKRLDNASRRRR